MTRNLFIIIIITALSLSAWDLILSEVKLLFLSVLNVSACDPVSLEVKLVYNGAVSLSLGSYPKGKLCLFVVVLLKFSACDPVSAYGLILNEVFFP